MPRPSGTVLITPVGVYTAEQAAPDPLTKAPYGIHTKPIRFPDTRIHSWIVSRKGQKIGDGPARHHRLPGLRPQRHVLPLEEIPEQRHDPAMGQKRVAPVDLPGRPDRRKNTIVSGA
jgi:hypothetical protein